MWIWRCEDGWRGVRARSALSLLRRAGAPRPQDLDGAPLSSASLSPGAVMPASSREKSPRVSRVLSMISSDAKKSHGEAREAKVVEAEGEGETSAHSTFTKTPRSPRIKKSKRGILPYFRGHKSNKKAEKEKEKSKKEKGDGTKASDAAPPDAVAKDTEAQLPSKVETPELVTKDTDVLDVLLSKEPGESDYGVDVDVSKSITDSVSAPVEESEECEVESESDKCDPEDLVDVKTYSLIHSRMAKYESPLKKTQIYQKSFLHNRYGSTPSVETLPARLSAGVTSSCSSSPVSSVPSLVALRSRTLEPSTRSSQDPLGRAALTSLAKSSTLDTVKARFHNHVNNLTYEGMNFTGGEPSPIATSGSSSSWSLGGRGFSSPFSKFSAHSTENLKATGKDKDKKLTKNSLSHEPKAVAKSGVKKILLHSRLKDDPATDTSPDRKVKATGSLPGTTTTVEPVSRNLDSITIISNKNVTAKLNITVVKTPETVRKGSFRFTRTGGFRSSLRASQRRRREPRSPLSSTSSSLSTSSSSLPASSTTTTTTTTAEGKTIPEYAKVNKRKNSKPDIVEEENFSRLSPSLPHAHESPAEKAPVVKKIEAAAYKARKDSDPTLKVNPVKKSESFKAGVRVGRRSSLTYASRAKMMKETLEGESFVKTQAVKLRRKDSKNGRLDMKNARKAEYRLSVTIKPSTVATLANKFNTIISQNQAGAPAVKSELPLGHVSVQKARMQRSPQASIRLKNRPKAARAEPEAKDLPEGAKLMDEKSKKEEKNREEKRADPSARKNAARSSRSPSPKKSPQTKSPASLLEKLGDNKTDEEKVCEKIKTALSSGKFKGETDDSEDEAAEKKSTDEEKCRSRLPSPSPSPSTSGGLRSASQPGTEQPSTSAADLTSVSSALAQTSSTIPKTKNSSEKTQRDIVTDVLGQIPQQPINILTEIDQVFPLPERHAKSDSMDSGISTEGDRLSGAGSPNLPSTSLASTSTPCLLSSGVEDSSLETVISTDTFRSEDSAVVVKGSGEASPEPGPSSGAQNSTSLEQETPQSSQDEQSEAAAASAVEKDGGAAASKGEEEESKDGAEPLEKGIIDGLETEGKPGNEQADCEGGRGNPEEDPEDKSIEADLRSIASSNMDDTHSEVSSVCSEAKSKRSASRGHESRIYTAVKTAVKNTVKKTKEKDAERKEERERERRNRSPSADREKWYRRGRSRERGKDKKKDDKDQGSEEGKSAEDGDKDGEDKTDSPKKEGREREGRTYERFTFKKLREKSQERKRNKDKAKEEKEMRKEEEKRREEERKSSGEEPKKDGKSKKKEDKEKDDNTYGKWTIRSRSRSRDRRKNKKILEQLNLEEAEAAKEAEEPSTPGSSTTVTTCDSSCMASGSSLTLPRDMKQKSEDLVFTFDTESLYDKPQTPKTSMKSKTLPPPPKTPIPSPPSSATTPTPIPPPPKTPIPDPPTESKSDGISESQDALNDDSMASDQSNGDSDSSNETENIYENLYAPDLEKLNRNREKLENRGIKPNSSFLWSDGAQAPAASDVSDKKETVPEDAEPERSPFTRLIGVRTYGRMDRYGKISPSNRGKEVSSEGHNYAELQQGSEDTQTLAYDDIGAVSAVSYDDIGAPSSCGYDDIRAPSTVGYDTIRPPSEGYDPVNPPRSDSSQYDDCDGGIVTAQFAVVREDQLDSISYMYDEISMYNASQNSHSYEPVYPPGVPPQGKPGVCSIEEVPEPETPTYRAEPMQIDNAIYDGDDASLDGSQDDSEDGVHEVFSYKLTRIGGILDAMPPALTPTTPTTPSTPGSSVHTRIYGGAPVAPLSLHGGELMGGEGAPSPSLSPTEGKSETSDEWMDVSDTETDTSTGPPVCITTQIPLVRMRQRSKRWRPRNWRRSWSQGVRDVAAHTHAHAHTIGHTYGSSGRNHEDEIEYSWREGGDSEDEDNATGHYEAIYEVINPAEDEHLQRSDDHDFDDSFDSDDSDEAYSRLRPQFLDDGSQTSRDHPESLSSEVSASDKLQQQNAQQQQQQQYGITKIAEAANLGMRRLRRNWSLTKNEVRTGLNRIKKKSTFSASDIKSTENLACDLSPTSADNKRKWSFKSHFRRKSSAGSVTSVTRAGPPATKKESATFYLTLTIETERQDAGEMSDASQRTIRSDSESVLSNISTKEYRKSNTPSIASVTTQSSCDTSVQTRQRPVSSIYSKKGSTGSSCGSGPVRPRTAPPAPPPKEKLVDTRSGENEPEELSKANVASKLNQLLSSGPTAPPGRRVLRTSECSSSDTSPVPVLIHPDDSGYAGLRPNSVKYATIDMSNLVSNSGGDSSGDERALGLEVASSIMQNVPKARTSVVSAVSHGSSEGYIRPADIASAPPPLPARRTPAKSPPNAKSSSSSSSRRSHPVLLHMPSSLVDGDNNSYLDFSCDALNQDEPLYVSSHFADEPLYQFYTATVLERATQNQGDCSSEDDYEVINDGHHNSPPGKLQSRPSAMELVTPADGRRTLWCELPEVIESGILSQINSQEKKMQEAMFEMITSEASYLKSLNVLVTHFVQCPEFAVDEGEDAVLTRRERHILFSDILPVKRCSEMLLADLEKRWQESVRISKLSDIILKHAHNHSQAYVKYCSNQIYQDRILKELKENNPRFLEVLNRLESSPVCQSLAMHSFLMLPMQRITRLPLLVDAIFHRLEYGTPEWNECKLALATLTKIVAECNEGARKMERMEEMLIISRQLDFREVKAIPLISASRWLVKKGEMTRLTWRENDVKLTFGRRISKHTLYFFLFTDLLVVTKKKSDDQYMVLDYCSRNMVQVLELDAADKFPGRILDGHKNLLILTMLQNHENKTVEMVVSCPMESDRTRWVEAVTPRSSDNPDERIYEEWDCPQVQAIHPYVAKQPDELSLEVSDVVNVLKKMADVQGFYIHPALGSSHPRTVEA
ncbi:uncharacterized protein LOC122257816 isoform X3 [Penaeus japonicus]|uniref:uncharacterized protein LOC122257816 isoform X3 n=1 Tax=Penaeus japonicus TaxID=27405 RepID=UPI001C711A77|nr:uncharacterized protein LOC122257816 isoform X3 [Penaeus japonicus]